MITKIPKMLTANKRKLTETFDYVHTVMRVPHHVIVRFPQVRRSQLCPEELPPPLVQNSHKRTMLSACEKPPMLFVKESDQTQSSSESCIKAIFFFLIYFNWRLITLQYCSGFCHTLT